MTSPWVLKTNKNKLGGIGKGNGRKGGGGTKFRAQGIGKMGRRNHYVEGLEQERYGCIRGEKKTSWVKGSGLVLQR